jgi:hypothetical protein
MLKSIGIVASARVALHSYQIHWNISGFGIAVVAQNWYSHSTDFLRHRMLLNMTLNFFPNFRGFIGYCLATSRTSDGLHNLHLIHHTLTVGVHVVPASQYHHGPTGRKHILKANRAIVLHSSAYANVVTPKRKGVAGATFIAVEEFVLRTYSTYPTTFTVVYVLFCTILVP